MKKNGIKLLQNISKTQKLELRVKIDGSSSIILMVKKISGLNKNQRD
jgi:hypothetical protein